jgi:cupin 2 domain-containing protein
VDPRLRALIAAIKIMLQLGNLLADIPAELPDEVHETLLSAPSLRIERIISLGHKSPEGFWYDQDENEWVLLVAGAARLKFEDQAEVVEMRPGSFVNIAAHRRHSVEYTDPKQPTIWLAIYYSSS